MRLGGRVLIVETVNHGLTDGALTRMYVGRRLRTNRKFFKLMFMAERRAGGRTKRERWLC